MNPSITLMTITPQVADQWLTLNTNNRPARKSHVARLAEAMERGEFRLTGDPVRWAGEVGASVLVDGQHRLMAVVRSGMTVQSFVMTNVPEETAMVIDTAQVQRTLADLLEERGETRTKTLASIINSAMQLERGEYYTGWTPSRPQALAWFDANPEVRESVGYGTRVREALKYLQGQAGALHYVFSRVDSDDANEFWNRLTTGTGLEAGNPILVLRQKIEKSAAVNREVMKPKYRAAITIKAWNYWRAGDSISMLKWKPGGVGREAFPDWRVGAEGEVA